MEEMKRQKQVARLIQEEMSMLFQKEGLSMVLGGMVSIAAVKVTPDLLEARIYLSLYQIEHKDLALKVFVDKTPELRKALGNRLRHQLRRIPLLQFFIDDTLDEVFKLEEIFKSIKNDDKADPNAS